MHHLPMSAVPIALMLAFAAGVTTAQGTGDRAAPGPCLVDLRVVLDASVYALDPLRIAQSANRTASGPLQAGATPRLFAALCDARFDAEGRLVGLVVASPQPDPRQELPLRTLPASAFVWNPVGPMWALVSPTLQFHELVCIDAKAPNLGTAAGTWLASRLLRSQQLAGAGAAPAQPSGTTSAPAPPTRIWMAPERQRLVVVSSPIPVQPATDTAAHRYVVVPWSLVRLSVDGDALCVGFAATSARLAAAPECDAARPPSADLRRRAYAHFALEVPGWDPLDGERERAPLVPK